MDKPNRPQDIINPEHYRTPTGSIESVDVIEAFFADDAHLSQAFKYMSRAGKKTDSSYPIDIQKAKWWLERALVHFENEEMERLRYTES